MIVEFSEGALADEAAWPALSQIVELFVAGRHKWLVCDWELLLASAWYQDLGGSSQRRVKTLERVARATARGEPWLVSVLSTTDHPARLGPDIRLPATEASRYLAQPLHLVVEDGPSDGAFIRAILLVLAEKCLQRHLGQDEFSKIKVRWPDGAFGDGTFFRVIAGGGGRMGDNMKGTFQASPVPMLAIVDSDHPAPQSAHAPLPRSTWAGVELAVQELAQGGTSVPAPTVLALRRREMENYVPPAALKEKYPKHLGWVDAYAGLGDAHRAHLDLKDGLVKSLEGEAGWQWKENSVGKFWEQVDESERTKLLRGLGNKVSECWGCRAVHRQSINNWAGPELNKVVEAVLSLL